MANSDNGLTVQDDGSLISSTRLNLAVQASLELVQMADLIKHLLAQDDLNDNALILRGLNIRLRDLGISIAGALSDKQETIEELERTVMGESFKSAVAG